VTSRHEANYYGGAFVPYQRLALPMADRSLRSVKLDAETADEVSAIDDLTEQSHSEMTTEAIQRAIHLIDLESSLLRPHAFPEWRVNDIVDSLDNRQV